VPSRNTAKYCHVVPTLLKEQGFESVRYLGFTSSELFGWIMQEGDRSLSKWHCSDLRSEYEVWKNDFEAVWLNLINKKGKQVHWEKLTEGGLIRTTQVFQQETSNDLMDCKERWWDGMMEDRLTSFTESLWLVSHTVVREIGYSYTVLLIVSFYTIDKLYT